MLPSESATRIALNRLWPIALFAIVAGALGAARSRRCRRSRRASRSGVAAAWRSREAAVTAVEERDGVIFFVENGSAFEPVKLIRSPGLRRGAASP